MNLTKAVRKQLLGENRVRDIFSKHRIYKSHHMVIWEEYLEFLDKLPKDTPKWLKSYFNGMSRVLMDLYYRNDVEFCYVINGKIVSVYKGSTRNYKNFGISVSELGGNPSGHFWKGSDKLFSDVSIL